MKFSKAIFLSFFLGALTLCLMSFIQKNIAGFPPFKLKGYYIPFFYGGFMGSLVGWCFSNCNRQKDRFLQFFNYSNDWEYWQNEKGVFIHTSPSCKTITGYTPEEFAASADLLQKIILPEDWSQWEDHSHTMLMNEVMEPVEFRIRTKAGEVRWIHHICSTVHDKNGINLGVRGSNRDITDLKALRSEVKTLRGFLPICSTCKKIRDDSGYWKQIEAYIRDHSHAEFTHSICPECREKYYSSLGKEQK